MEPDHYERLFPMPAHSRLLVKLLDDSDLDDSIILPPGVRRDQDLPERGIVTHVGPGYRLWDGGYSPMDYLPGDEVLFFAHKGVPVEIEGETLFLLRDENVLVVLSGAPSTLRGFPRQRGDDS